MSASLRIADIYLGMQEVVLVIRDGEAKKPIRMPFKVEVCDELLTKLRDLLGEANVKVN